MDIVSEYSFAPTPLSRDNLLRERKSENSIYVTGNTVIDAMQHTVRPDYTHPELGWVGDDKLIFITAHRRENLGQPMHQMFRAIRRVLEEHRDAKAVFPIHMNPVVREAYEQMSGAVNPYGDGHACERIADVLEGKGCEEWKPAVSKH